LLSLKGTPWRPSLHARSSCARLRSVAERFERSRGLVSSAYLTNTGAGWFVARANVPRCRGGGAGAEGQECAGAGPRQERGAGLGGEEARSGGEARRGGG